LVLAFLVSVALPAQAQSTAGAKALTIWGSTFNGALMGAVGGAAVAALSDRPENNYEDYVVQGAGAGTLAGMAFGVFSVTDFPASRGGGGGGGGTQPPAPAPQPGAAFGYDPRYGLWFQPPALRIYPAGPEGNQKGYGLTVISGRF
jgi:hypothetical protein